MAYSKPIVPLSQVRRIGEIRQILGYGDSSTQYHMFRDTFETFRRGYQTLAGKPGTSLHKWQTHQSELDEMADTFLVNHGHSFWRDHADPGGNLGEVILAYSNNKEAIKNHLKQLIYRLNEAHLSNFKSGKTRQDPDQLPYHADYTNAKGVEADGGYRSGSSYHPTSDTEDDARQAGASTGSSDATWAAEHGGKSSKRKHTATELHDDRRTKSARTNQTDASQNSTGKAIDSNADSMQSSLSRTTSEPLSSAASQIDMTYMIIKDGDFKEWYSRDTKFMDMSLGQVVSEISEMYPKDALSRLMFRLCPADDNGENQRQWVMNRQSETAFKMAKMAMRRQTMAWLKDESSRPMKLYMEIEIVSEVGGENKEAPQEASLF